MIEKTSILAIRAGSLLAQHHITTLCNELAAQGFPVTLVSIHFRADEPPPPGLDTRIHFSQIPYLPGRGVRALCSRLRAAWLLRRQLAETSPRLVYVLDSPVLPLYWLASLGYHTCRDCRLVYHTFEWLDPGITATWRLRLERAIARQADLVVNADRTRARLMQSFYRLAETPIDLPVYLPFNTVFPTRDAARRRMLLGPDAPPDAILIICPSVASADRLTLELLEGIARLPARYRLFTITRGDTYGQACAKRVEECRLATRVTFSQPLVYTKLLEIAADSDIGIVFHDTRGSAGNFMCHPSRMSMFVGLGMPFIGTDVPNLAAVVYRYQLGVCCNPSQPEAVASAIRHLAEEPPGLSARRQHIRGVFEKELCFDRHAAGFTEELRRLCGGFEK